MIAVALWSEGMFLRPQHFQQAEALPLGSFRSISEGWHRRGTTGDFIPWCWMHIAGNGKVAIARASGVMPDGTTFSFPDPNEPPKAIEIPDTLKGKRVSLCLPVYRSGQ